MTLIERRVTGIQQQQPDQAVLLLAGQEQMKEEPQSPDLICAEALPVQSHQWVIVDDLTNGHTPYSQYLDQMVALDTGVLPLTNKELDRQLADMLQATTDALDLSPDDITVICPGGGGNRTLDGVKNAGFRLGHSLSITTARDKDSFKTVISDKSKEELLALKKCRLIMPLDDAINTASTIQAILDVLEQNPELQDAIVIVGAQILFVKQGDAEDFLSGRMKGVDRCNLTLAAKAVIGSDPKDSTKPAPATYFSSLAKRMPTKDSRIEEIARRDPQKKAQLLAIVEQVKRKYLREQLPIHPLFNQYAEILAAIDNPETMKRFLGDSMITEEMTQWTRRLHAAERITDTPSEETTMSENRLKAVMAESNLKKDTVERVEEWCLYGHGGYKDALEVYAKQNGETLPVPEVPVNPLAEGDHFPEEAFFDKLVATLTLIQDPDMMKRFLGDSLTTDEMMRFSRRTAAAYAIHQTQRKSEELSRDAIKRVSELRDDTVQRVQEWYQDGYGGYAEAFTLYNARKDQETGKETVLFTG